MTYLFDNLNIKSINWIKIKLYGTSLPTATIHLIKYILIKKKYILKYVYRKCHLILIFQSLKWNTKISYRLKQKYPFLNNISSIIRNSALEKEVFCSMKYYLFFITFVWCDKKFLKIQNEYLRIISRDFA